jgi:quercetin dioxygenase-like cupin family protein
MLMTGGKSAVPQNEVDRRVLLTQSIPLKTVKTVDIREIRFSPGQKGGYHRHPCPVFGLILEGEALLQVEGQEQRVLRAGDAFYEPQGAPIVHFDNASAVKPMRFVAFYLIDNETQLIEML